MDYDVAKQLYNPNREYLIVETSHDSSFDTNNKKPSIKHNTYLYGWLHNQRRNYKHKKEIMKLEEIYKIWTEILNNPKSGFILFYFNL